MMRLRAGQCFLTMLLCCLTLLAAAQITDPSEVSALGAIKNSLVDPMKHLKNWNEGDPCTSNWTGVLCFDKLGNDSYLHVQQILLLDMKLSGTLTPELGQLSQLRILDFMWNNISGSIPKEVGNIASLELFQLDNNNFNEAEIPASFGNMSKLLKLSLRNCSLHGAVPDLSGIPRLHYLDLSMNHLTGSIPSNQLPKNMTTIDLSDNQLTGSIPEGFSDLPFLQKLSLENNLLTGSIHAKIWQDVGIGAKTRLLLDLRKNSISNILGDLNPPPNVTLRLQGNPICSNATIQNIDRFCEHEAGGDNTVEDLENSTVTCPVQLCHLDNNFEYVPSSPLPCYCASPLRIGYRLKSPSFYYFLPYVNEFENYLTRSLNLHRYQLSIESIGWEGPRLRMYLKLFPAVGDTKTFNESEILRIRGRFTSWQFNGIDLFGPYELLNFTLLGPYSDVNLRNTGGSISKGMLIATVLAAVASSVTISAIVAFFIARRHARNKHIMPRKRLSSKHSIKIDGVKSFTFNEMALATEDFSSSTQVGQGGYGNVYRGILSDNTVVAIKRAKEGSLQGNKEFLTEIEMLSRLHHRNLVSLVGYCDEEGEQMVVYEFMPNGTLQDWLSAKSKECLNFGMRLRIALGSAKGILYLHTDAHPPIFHRDIKASNILLDSKLTAKVSDFGLSRLAPVLDDEGTVPGHVSTVVKGTPGYLDPEYLLTHMLTDKSDVYSLGVVFLEILTGMQPISHGKNIVREVILAHRSGTMFSIIDSRMGSYPSECVERFVDLAIRCCEDEPERRPSMLDVVRELENIIRMMPQSEIYSSESTSQYFGESSTSSLLTSASRDPYISSSASGNDLTSSVIPSLTPR
ncbi:probable LRR receptor-like serine/threonine-protein kinase At1g06840 isoform X2 [Diospyros lotus]|uniref:probable LRR receptor-like serine/threonine-protein kinase At1g06840 isoform X2 n=1 Tax=Diospyros lotus TaxID=55363 RepID=UPI00224F560B|nr:probable LRR receptor-like serine/threonine-protein kinase At1g06840 isoform X2 [Diospyros lotus]